MEVAGGRPFQNLLTYFARGKMYMAHTIRTECISVVGAKPNRSNKQQNDFENKQAVRQTIAIHTRYMSLNGLLNYWG